jgi:hypothetical protein
VGTRLDVERKKEKKGETKSKEGWLKQNGNRCGRKSSRPQYFDRHGCRSTHHIIFSYICKVIFKADIDGIYATTWYWRTHYLYLRPADHVAIIMAWCKRPMLLCRSWSTTWPRFKLALAPAALCPNLWSIYPPIPPGWSCHGHNVEAAFLFLFNH